MASSFILPVIILLLQAFDRRKSVLTESEKKYFAKLNKEYMTDESDSSDSEHITVHKHSWRSQSKLVAMWRNH